jgi:hypothetical protein
MIPSPLELAESLRIGTVEFVSPDRIEVSLDIEAPESVALNTGTPRPFPRVNSYVLLPSDEGYLVGQVVWLTIERSAFPKRRGMRDFGLIDLPYPLRKMRLSPLGTLQNQSSEVGEEKYSFRRGADVLPCVGDCVLLPTPQQLRSIVESGENRRVKIGTSALAGNASVCVDPDRLFGRHLAVLGNTGSGKSCSVAGLIRWSLEAIPEGTNPNARFIVLDPNGEYRRAFGKESGSLKPRQFDASPSDDVEQLRLPIWFWNSAEWSSFAQASAKTQRPTLIHALRMVRDGQTEPSDTKSHDMRRFLRTIVSIICVEAKTGSPWGTFPKPKSFCEKIKKWATDLEAHDSFTEDENAVLKSLKDYIDELVEARSKQYPHYDFEKSEVDLLLKKAREAHTAFGGGDTESPPSDADTPLEFSGDSFLRSLEASAELLNVSEHVETMLIRIRTLLADSTMRSIFGEVEDVALHQWLKDYIGGNLAGNGCLTIIDLSFVPSEVIHIVTAVIARMVLEALQRYRKLNEEHKVLPTVLVMEEAHTFVRRYRDDIDSQDAATVCCRVFERIAREGRKFGLGLVLASQRPSELSPTVLSQCNSFLLHRISNDRDQDLVMMNDLPKEQQPQSDDPDFWKVWTGEEKREVDWKQIADSWQGKTTSSSTGDLSSE